MPVVVMGLVATLALGTAEARSMWHLYAVTNLDTSAQGMLLSKTHDYRGRHVCRDRSQSAEAFVVRAMLGGTFHVLDQADRQAPRDGRNPGELVLLSAGHLDPFLRLVGKADGQSLYEETDRAGGAYDTSATAPKR
jgi:hypothetical protein